MVRPVLSHQLVSLQLQELADDAARARRARGVAEPAPDNKPRSIWSSLLVAIRRNARPSTA